MEHEMTWKLSASMVLCARTPSGFKVLFVQRSKTSRVFPNVYVFPGGKVEQCDFEDHTTHQCNCLNTTSSQNGNQRGGHSNCQGSSLNVSSSQNCSCQKQYLPSYNKDAAQSTEIGVPLEVLKACAGRELWEETGLRVDAQRAQYLCAFLTPDIAVAQQEKGGFDCVFFLACIDDVQGVSPDNTEVVAAVWETPKEALHQFLVAWPQRYILQLLCMTPFESLYTLCNRPFFRTFPLKPHMLSKNEFTLAGDHEDPNFPGPRNTLHRFSGPQSVILRTEGLIEGTIPVHVVPQKPFTRGKL